MNYKKDEKNFYFPKNIEITNTPKAGYVKIDGVGDPNTSTNFTKHVEELYKFSYAIRMSYKKPENTIPGYETFTVYPLEGDWSLTNIGIEEYQKNKKINKKHLKYTLMIRQPHFVNQTIFKKFLNLLIANNNENEFLQNLYFEIEKPQKICHMVHIGSYDDEPKSFAKMMEFTEEQNHKRLNHDHRETYLSDARRVAADKLKTKLAFLVD